MYVLCLQSLDFDKRLVLCPVDFFLRFVCLDVTLLLLLLWLYRQLFDRLFVKIMTTSGVHTHTHKYVITKKTISIKIRIIRAKLFAVKYTAI